MAENDHNLFAPGFMLGLFSGVVGYFVFGTKEGKKIRQRMSFEWEQAQDYLVDQGVLDKSNQFDSWADLLDLAKTKLLDKLEIEPDTPKKSKTHRKKRTYRRQAKQKKFKGV